MTWRILDLFCGGGGAGMGYRRAGWEVVGVDIAPQPRYPFEFIQGDALKYVKARLFKWGRYPEFQAVHASPPCQRFSDLAHRNGNAHEHPDLVGPIRELLEATGLPYVIENVEGAPLVDPVMLCGTMFYGRRVLRHRLFETNWSLRQPEHHGKHPLCYTRDKRKAHYGKLDEWKDFVTVTGGGNCSVAAARDAMGIDWMTKNELNEAIPPAYTQWVGNRLVGHIQEMALT